MTRDHSLASDDNHQITSRVVTVGYLPYGVRRAGRDNNLPARLAWWAGWVSSPLPPKGADLQSAAFADSLPARMVHRAGVEPAAPEGPVSETGVYSSSTTCAYWCTERDSNSHEPCSGHRDLNPACLPVPPSVHVVRPLGFEPRTCRLRAGCSSS